MIIQVQGAGSLQSALFKSNITGGKDIVITAGDTIKPDANDSAALGASGTAFSDLFLASGAVINFNASNFTITHSAGSLAFSGNVRLDGDLEHDGANIGFFGVGPTARAGAYTKNATAVGS